MPLIRNVHVLFWDRPVGSILVRPNGMVINHVEVVLNITDNGAAVKKGYIVYLTTHLLPVKKAMYHCIFFGLNCNIKFIVISE